MKSQKKLSKNDIFHIAKLANLQISDDELDDYVVKLSDSLDYVANLSDVDTSKVASDFYTTSARNVTKEDSSDTKRTFSQKTSTAGSEKIKNGYFVVKKIL